MDKNITDKGRHAKATQDRLTRIWEQIERDELHLKRDIPDYANMRPREEPEVTFEVERYVSELLSRF